jgi:spore coat polysaccharide biosynthesis predicted glycosyltransferase SpsG
MLPIVAIRTHASSSIGIGHLARTYRLAVALKKYDLESHYFLDSENPLFEKFLHPFKYTYLYQGHEKFKDEESDAYCFMDCAKEYHIEAVVIDDYRFARIWEGIVERLGCPLIVLDDRDLVRHQCSMIVDAKWTGVSTSERYKGKVPSNCLRLLGPENVLIDESYTHSGTTSNNHTFKNVKSIMVSLGGGGDMTIMGELVKKMLYFAPGNVDFIIQPVIGYFATNKDIILSIAANNRRVKPISHARSLHKYFKTTALYIGAAGGTLYEVLSMNIPAVTFELAQNQNNSVSHLEDLGHYFHLNEFSEKLFDKLAKLTWSMISNINRIQNLYAEPKKVKIDGQGAKRMAKNIDSLIKNVDEIYQSSDSCSRQTKKTGDQSYDFERVDDRHVNRYLDARNLSANLQNMTETEKVHRVDHYLWWLETRRISFLLKKGGQPLLYIWHMPRTIDETTVLTGGWFVCSEFCAALDALYALNLQLQLTDKEFSGLPWVAVIRKTNRFVMSLNKRFEFEIMDENHHLFQVACKCFPSATKEDFNYLFR